MPVFSAIAAMTTAELLAAGGLAVGMGSLAMTATQKMPSVSIPKAEVPAVAAPGNRTDTGASVSVGTSAEDIKNQRVSGGTRKSTSSSGDVLGGLGRSGLSI